MEATYIDWKSIQPYGWEGRYKDECVWIETSRDGKFLAIISRFGARYCVGEFESFKDSEERIKTFIDEGLELKF